MNQAETYVAHNGNTYEGSPPADWWQAQDGRWYPPEMHPQHGQQPAAPQWAPPMEGGQSGPHIEIRERPWWKKKRLVIPGALLALAVLAPVAGALVAVGSGDDVPEPAAEEAARSTTSVAASRTTEPTTAAPSTVGGEVDYPLFGEHDRDTWVALLTALDSNTQLRDELPDERIYVLAMQSCRNLDADDTMIEAIAEVSPITGVVDGASLVAVAVAAFCPHHAQLVDDFVEETTG